MFPSSRIACTYGLLVRIGMTLETHPRRQEPMS
jgi:hypothetical protein